MSPYYRATGREEEVFLAAYAQRLPVLLKGPTGCGKSRFVEAMAHRLERELRGNDGVLERGLHHSDHRHR